MLWFEKNLLQKKIFLCLARMIFLPLRTNREEDLARG